VQTTAHHREEGNSRQVDHPNAWSKVILAQPQTGSRIDHSANSEDRLLQVVPGRNLVFSNSDTAFFRRFSRDNPLVNGKIGLLDVDDVGENTNRWTATARRLLGLLAHHGGSRNHAGNMMYWTVR
jgi:hypothetical protein